MGEEQSTEKTAVKAAEHEEKVTKREQPADKTGQGGRGARKKVVRVAMDPPLLGRPNSRPWPAMTT
jgi:hypothetical protein